MRVAMRNKKDTVAGDLSKSSGAKRQETYRQRQKAAGKRQFIAWIDNETWDEGFKAGHAGKPASPVPSGIDPFAWFSGWVEGDAKRQGFEYSKGTKK